MGPSGSFTHIYIYISYDVVWDRLCTLSIAPCTKKTLPDFR